MALLSNEVKFILNCRDATYYDNQVSPARGAVISDKKERIVAALRRGDSEEGNYIEQELWSEVNYWLSQNIQTVKIDTKQS
ncbi:hypothetical protein NIES2101_08350 [Calothrix sp. HK-06]|nr:hypothetical protein NIES2101_08350 [Calothrix sp. HK-06]